MEKFIKLAEICEDQARSYSLDALNLRSLAKGQITFEQCLMRIDEQVKRRMVLEIKESELMAVNNG